MPPLTASGGISPEWFKRGSPNVKRLSGTSGPRNLPDPTSLVTSCRLQNAIKYWTKVMRKTDPVGQRVNYIFRPLFNPDPPHVARTSVPTLSTATPDMTSPATSDRHLPKFEKLAKCHLRRLLVEFWRRGVLLFHPLADILLCFVDDRVELRPTKQIST